ncbi:glutathione synthase [Snodgrassella alvi]|uniref:Glutathione synthetase n=1 Tax=Snodgrassella alvi TaxID=1196083 RepID=A0A2N9WT35_9NEIS|nr:glutathione synthase [Snodgrassella alvi]PIT14419.1 glutathione synthase [Snodgrassella alvi]PIT18236.1 glutathione synthase [Snodgrassella alvi]PIT21349.1 glutathione synthase [Snodgrassella alvi]
MKILFIADPMAGFKTYKDTTYAMMREMARRGWKLFHTLASQLSVQQECVVASASEFSFTDARDEHDHDWFNSLPPQQCPLNRFDAVIMRTDPPFDMQYLYATQLLTLAAKQGAYVYNSGQAMRDFNEKLAILDFPEFTAPTLVTTHAADVRAFLNEHQDIIIKPLDGMGGMGIFRLKQNDPNIGSILEMLMRLDSRTIMAQRYIPEIVHGDKRILIIGGKVVPYALARIPQQGETRGNLAAGGRGVAQPLSERDLQIAETLAPELVRRGILLAGLDVIGDYLTEINVTSPTGFQEITKQTDCDVAALFADAVEEAARLHGSPV